MTMSLCKKVEKYLLRKGIGVLRINVFAIHQSTLVPPVWDEDLFHAKVVDSQVLDDILLIRGKKKGAHLRNIWKNGAYGTSFYKNNSLAAYGWIGVNNGDYGRRLFSSFAIPPHSAHIFDCFTVEKFRGQNLYPAIVKNLALQAWQLGIANVYIDVVSDNTRAIKGIEKLGLELVSKQVKVMFLNKILFEYDHKR